MLSGGSGAGFQASGGPTPKQMKTSYNQTQDSIKQQQDFVNQLQAQNGLGNQASVFQQQQGLANQLQGVANGTGPNPAQNMLNQATGQNVSNQAALMAGQRGASANTGLIARQAAMQGANTQQQAAGQAATMQSQQQLAAMQQLQNQQASMGNLANTQVGQAQTGLQQLGQQSLQQQANLYGLQSNINSTNAGIAAQNAGAQAGLLGNMMGGVGSAIGMIGKLGGSSTAGGAGGDLMAGGGDSIAGGAGGEAAMMVAAQGGMVPKKMAMGGESFDPMMQTPQAAIAAPTMVSAAPMSPVSSGPQSYVTKMFNDTPMPQASAPKANPNAGLNQIKALGRGVVSLLPLAGKVVGGVVGGIYGQPQLGAVAGGAIGSAGEKAIASGYKDDSQQKMAKGGKVPALVSPGERYLPPQAVDKVAKGKEKPMKAGEKIPGKPKVSGDENSYSNDTVHRNLDEGGIVLPRSVTQSKNPDQAAAEFVRSVLAKHPRK